MLSNDQAQNLKTACSEGHSHSEFTCALRHIERGDRIDSHERERDRNAAKDAADGRGLFSVSPRTMDVVGVSLRLREESLVDLPRDFGHDEDEHQATTAVPLDEAPATVAGDLAPEAAALGDFAQSTEPTPEPTADAATVSASELAPSVIAEDDSARAPPRN